MRLKHLETCPCGSQLQVEVDGGSEEVWEMVNCSVLNWRQLHRRHLKVDIAPQDDDREPIGFPTGQTVKDGED